AGEGAFIERHARDHADVELPTARKQLVLRRLIEDVVDDLHRVDESRLERAKCVRRLPPVDAHTHRRDQPLSAKIIHRALPPRVRGPRVLPDVELQQINPRNTEILETSLGEFADVVRRKYVVERELAS